LPRPLARTIEQAAPLLHERVRIRRRIGARRILTHLGLDGSEALSHPLPLVRAPPIGSSGLFD